MNVEKGFMELGTGAGRCRVLDPAIVRPSNDDTMDFYHMFKLMDHAHYLDHVVPLMKNVEKLSR